MTASERWRMSAGILVLLPASAGLVVVQHTEPLPADHKLQALPALVAISRARHEARIYTDDLGRLPAAVARENHKDAALDLVRERGRDRRAARTGPHDLLPHERDWERV